MKGQSADKGNFFSKNMDSGDMNISFLEKIDTTEHLSKCNSFSCEKMLNNLSEITFFHIQEITFEEKEKTPRREAFENVLGTIRETGANFIYLILGDEKGVSFYFGIARDLKESKELSMPIIEMGDTYLKSSIHGNFRGSKIEKLTPSENKEILERLEKSVRFGAVTGVPGINESSDQSSFQGIDRLIDVMLGDRFGLCIIAKPIMDDKLREIENSMYEIYNMLGENSKQNIQDGANSSVASTTTNGSSKTKTTGTNLSTASTTGTSESKSEGKSSGKNETIGYSLNESKGTSSSLSVGKTATSGESNSSGSSSSSKGTNSSTSDSSNETKGENSSTSEGSSKSKGTSTGENHSTSKGTSSSKSTTTGKSESLSSGSNSSEGKSVTSGTSKTVSKEVVNKRVQDWIKYFDEILFPMLDYGKSKGAYLTNTFIFSDKKGIILKLGNTMKSLFSGRKGNRMPLQLEILENDDKRVEYFKNLQIPESNEIFLNKEIETILTMKSNVIDDSKIEFGNWYSPNELSLIAGLPQKEVVGLSLKEEVEFGLNVGKEKDSNDSIILGNLVQSGNELNIDVCLNKKDLNKHVFVTGVTGTGKTTTCQKLLLETGDPFLVVEPAKTEYRILMDKEETKDILVFTLGKDNVSPFRLNPFEFYPHESISSRVDMLKAAMESSFDMEAAIPQLLESSMYECYKDYGWDLVKNINTKFKDPFAKGVCSFPTLEDLLNKIQVEVERQGFDGRLRDEYIGSIRARLQGLLVGAKGLMLNTGRGIDFRELIEKKVVLEIEEIKSGSEKSLIMGFILTNLVEALKAKYHEDRNFRHITLIEEAHRLLAKYEPGDSANRKQGIETFADMIAEVRKYGESLIIADQIPNKLTPEVLKNTNTKIVHKIFATDDKEAIGNTISLTKEQKSFLSNLTTGRAIVFSQGWQKALQVQIKRDTDTTSERFVEDGELIDRIIEFYHGKGIIPGLDYLEEKPTREQFEFCRNFAADQNNVKAFKEEFENKITTFKKFTEMVSMMVGTCSSDLKKLIKGEKIEDSDKFINELKRICNEYSKEKFIDMIMLRYYSNIDVEGEGMSRKKEVLDGIRYTLVSLMEDFLEYGEEMGANEVMEKCPRNYRAILKENLNN